MKITPGAEVEDTAAWEPTASDHGDVLYEIGGILGYWDIDGC